MIKLYIKLLSQVPRVGVRGKTQPPNGKKKEKRVEQRVGQRVGERAGRDRLGNRTGNTVTVFPLAKNTGF